LFHSYSSYSDKKLQIDCTKKHNELQPDNLIRPEGTTDIIHYSFFNIQFSLKKHSRQGLILGDKKRAS